MTPTYPLAHTHTHTHTAVDIPLPISSGTHTYPQQCWTNSKFIFNPSLAGVGCCSVSHGNNEGEVGSLESTQTNFLHDFVWRCCLGNAPGVGSRQPRIASVSQVSVCVCVCVCVLALVVSLRYRLQTNNVNISPCPRHFTSCRPLHDFL